MLTSRRLGLDITGCARRETPRLHRSRWSVV